MNINEFNQAAAERVIKSLRDRGAEVSGRVIVKTLTGMKPENSGQLHEDQPYEITSWATKSNVDMEGEVVLPNGGDVTSYFSKNRTLFVDHEYDIMKAVGKCRWLKMTPKGWLIKSALINNLDNPYRKQVQALADSGNIGMSVGMEIVDSGPPMVDERKSYGNARNIIRKWKLLEVSYTAMPMNGDCQSDLVQESEPQMSIETKNAKKIFILGQDMVVRIKELRSKNCGTGAGGFKPGNTCAAEDGSNQGMRQESGKKPKVGTNQEYQQISDRKDRVLERLYDVGKTGSDQQKEALISKLESFSSENLKPINKLEGSIDRRVNRAIDHVMRGIMDEFEGSLGVDKERKPILRHTDGINVLLDSLEQHLGKTKMYVWSKDCGTGAGGFKPGNNCAAGDGSKNPNKPSEQSKQPKKPSEGQSPKRVGKPRSQIIDGIDGDVVIERTAGGVSVTSSNGNRIDFSQDELDGVDTSDPNFDAIDTARTEKYSELGRLVFGADKRGNPRATNSDIYEVWQQLQRTAKMYLQKKDCGTGAGGFKPGNTCASERGKESGVPVSTSETAEPKEERRSSSPALRAAKERASEISEMLDQKLDSDLGGNNYESYEDLNQLKRMNTSMNAWGMHSSMMQRYEEEKYLEIPESKGKTLPEQIDYQLQTARFNKQFIENELGRLEQESPDDYVRQVRRLDKLMQRFKMYVSSKDCGTGAGGFKPGNTCAAGDGSKNPNQPSGQSKQPKKPSEKQSPKRVGKPRSQIIDGIDGDVVIERTAGGVSVTSSNGNRIDFSQDELDGVDTSDPNFDAIDTARTEKYSELGRLVFGADKRGNPRATNSDIYEVWQQLQRTAKMYLQKKDCGTGAGGFKPGNTCAAGDGSNQERGRGSRATTEGPKRPGRSRSITLEGVNGDVVVSPTNDGVSVSSAGETIDLTKDEIFGMLESDPNYGDKYSRLGSIVFGGEAADTDMVQLLRQMRSVSQKMYFNWKD